MRTEFTAGDIATAIPYYLTAEDKDTLVRALSDFPNSIKYYSSSGEAGVLQGDCYSGVKIRRYDTGETSEIFAIVLSNSCDISSDNSRSFPVNALVSPLMPLKRFVTGLESRIPKERSDNIVASIKAQITTNILYLPAGNGFEEDYIVRLDDVYTIPAKVAQNWKNDERIQRSHLTGFYLFVFKLSVHFCRLRENVKRP